MTEFRIPKLNNNDDSYILVEWLAADGQEVKQGDPLVVIETSKTAEELESPADGTLVIRVHSGDCAPGELIAAIGAAVEVAEPVVPEVPPLESGEIDVVITRPAQALIERHGISLDRVRALGKKVIRAEDVESLADPREVVELPRAQRQAADVVVLSHQTIPAAFTVVKADVTDTAKLTRDLSKHARTLIGLSELLVKAVADQRAEFPHLFATWLGDGRIRLAEGSHVGVTIDVGKGLFVPVVRDADVRPLDAVARELMDYRMTALRGSFRERDLEGANIAVTLHSEAGVEFAIPIIYPGHVAALSLASTQQEVQPGDEGFMVRQTVRIGLAFDHRVVNGRDAALFLGAVKRLLEEPRRWLE
ncbi:dehydrogenase [Herbidospora sp. NEAU-GS84]|uniref:Dihydrolipoamide acetyltransferase component of pyruvate dehydrogenase complex n=1 Tax=Herbidospora solisilvae TaxID=2696284 RepID=A0A7C9NC14_9ACTN|nr:MULTISPECIES: 2-oxo acid dehydrogenase subunit E2 [Herbidospora]NAS20755.1 dehydrogenase [Herbidospora solisilvae]GLX93217.1 dihydrolipoamide acetyltransferase component of pyruvate dehydrogenase complex [Herbidospora sp. NBRC 101105]